MQTKKRKSSPQQGKQRKLPRKSSPQQGKQRKALHDLAAARLVKNYHFDRTPHCMSVSMIGAKKAKVFHHSVV